jgi:DHA1 family tetracycline resistance protein-like MFS transporter
VTAADGAARGPARAAFAFIFITVALDFLAAGVTIPVLPGLIAEFVRGDKARAAEYYGVFATVFAAMQFLCAPLMGALSDRFGRRTVILLSTLGLGIDFFLMALAPTLAWLFVARIVSGITSSSYATAMAYIADVTPPEQRAGKFGMLGAAFGIGFILGPAAGGLLGDLGLRVPFYVAGVLSLLGTAYGWFVLPESLPPRHRAPFDVTRANPFGAFQLLRARHALLGMALAVFLYRLAHDVMPSTYVLYVDYRYGWDAKAIGVSLAFLGVASMGVQAGLVGPLVRRLGERTAMLTGFTVGTLSMAGYALAPEGWMFIAIMPIGAFFGLAYPSLQGLMTRLVGPEEQGRLQGALASVMSVAAVLAPVLFTQLFAEGVARFGRPGSGAPLLLASLLLVVTAGIAGKAATTAAPA